jgi:hypothetical protein
MSSPKIKIFSIVYFLFFTLLIKSFSFSQTVQTFTATGAGSWTAPCGITSITVELWGAGGGGQRANGNPSMGGGGSGGAYIKVTYPVSPGTTYNYFVGAGGSGNSGQNGEDSWFDANTK